MRKWAIAWVALAFVGVACSSGSSNPDAGHGGSSGSGGSGGQHNEGGGPDAKPDNGGGPTAAAACMSYATALCANLDFCSKVFIRTNYADLTACAAAENQRCLNELSAPSTGATPAGKEACTAALSAWSCTDFLNGANIPPACATKLGSKASGASCAFSSQCSTGFCTIVKKQFCGVCATPPVAGGACTGGCGASLSCDTATMKCVAPGAMGGSCTDTAPCGAGLTCVGFDKMTMTAGKCETAVGMAGAKCSIAEKKVPGCDRLQGLECDPISLTCVDAVFGMDMMPCGLIKVDGGATGPKILCRNGANCTTTPTMPGVCQAAAKDMDHCTEAGRPCPTLERCVESGTKSDGGALLTCEFDNASTCK